MNKKLLLVRIMRITFLQVSLILSIFFTAAANDGKAQSALEEKITLERKDITLFDLLKILEKRYAVNFVYSSAKIGGKQLVSLTAENLPLRQVLREVLLPLDLKFSGSGDVIVIRNNNDALNVKQQNITITGKVTDKEGVSLPGVSIKVKGSNKSVLTNASGIYSIDVVDENSVIVFTYVGYNVQERQVKSNRIINIVLANSLNSLDEVIVIGYGTSRKRDLTGSVGQVSIADFEKAPVKSFDDALAGRVAGVQVFANDGQPGSMNNIIIRGTGSITQDNSPLYVVDGFPLEDSNNNSISPADIESIDILKDASATAIYGARGANGVIMITTKRGKKGDPVISYAGYYGFQENIKTIDLMSPYEFVKYQIELDPDEDEAPLRYLTDRTLESYKDEKSVDFQSLLYRSAPMQNHNLSLRGGTDKSKYSISGNIIQQDGIIINSGFNRYQGRIALDQTVSKKLRTGITVNYSNSKYTGTVPRDASFSASNNLLYAVWGYRPIAGTNGNSDVNLEDVLFDPDVDATLLADYRINPVISAKNEIRSNTNNSIFANGFAEYAIIPSLTFKITGGVTTNMVKDEAFYNSLTSKGNPRNANGVNGYIYNRPVTTFLNENTLTWKKRFNNDHELVALGGYSIQSNTSAVSGFSALNVPNESLGLDGLDQSPSQIGVSESSRWKLTSYLGRFNYTFKSKYLFTASFRADGSSKFAPGKRWGFFPSGSFAWRMNNEKFMSSLAFISNSKLRVSYGQTGNNRVSDFPYLSELTLPISAGYSYNNSTPSLGAIINAFGNPDLIWETTEQANIGYDLGLFNQRMDITVDWYRKTTHDLLLDALLPYTTGLSRAFKNIGKMQNQGVEITLNTINIKNRSFKWNSNVNISFNANKVLALTENQTTMTTPVSFDAKWNALSPYIAVIGQPVGQLYGLIWEGVYQYSDFNINSAGKYVLKANISSNGNPREGIQPGDIKYKDINRDGEVNSADFTIIGRGLPIHTGGISNNFTFKNFDLNVFLQWSYGNDLVNANKLLFEGNGKRSLELNQFASYENRWTPENTESNLFRTDGQGPAFYSSRLVEDGSFLRLKTISLGYNFPVKMLRSANLKSLRLYASAQNLITWTNYSGPDPEVSVRNSALTPGFDYSAYPRARTLIFGLNVSL